MNTALILTSSKETFYTPYQRQNHIDVVISNDIDTLCSKSIFAMNHILKQKRIHQTLARRYVINADYDYNPELIEVRK